MKLALVFALAGCNQIYGLESTQPQDARPRGCPDVSAGTGVPQFSRVVRQAIPRAYDEYHFNSARTFAVGLFAGDYLAATAVDTPPTIQTGLHTTLIPTYSNVRPAPDGKLYAIETNGTQRQLVVFDRQPTAWVRRAAPIKPLNANEFFSTVFLGPVGEDRLFVVDTAGTEIVEYEVATTFVERGRFPRSDKLSLFLNVTGDGLRAVFTEIKDDKAYYTDRPSTDVAFRTPEPIDVPAYLHAQLTDDCSRYYFVDLKSVFFIEQ
jgi:hypothetical protein